MASLFTQSLYLLLVLYICVHFCTGDYVYNSSSPEAGTGYVDTVTDQIDSPGEVVFNPDADYLYVADRGNHQIKQVDISTGEVTVLAGDSYAGWVDGNPLEARFNNPQGLAIYAPADSCGWNYFVHFLFVADSQNQLIRVIRLHDFVAQHVSTFAGQGAAPGFSNGHVIDSASMYYPTSVTTFRDGIAIADQFNHAIRFIKFPACRRPTEPHAKNPALPLDDVYMRTLTGNQGIPGHTDGDGITVNATLYYPSTVAVSSDGLDLYFTQVSSVRVYDHTNVTRTVAGSHLVGYEEGSNTTSIVFRHPTGLYCDSDGRIWVADEGNNMIRFITKIGPLDTDWESTTVAGKGYESPGDVDGDVFGSYFSSPTSVSGRAPPSDIEYLYISDAHNNKLKRMSAACPTLNEDGVPYAGCVNGGRCVRYDTCLCPGGYQLPDCYTHNSCGATCTQPAQVCVGPGQECGCLRGYGVGIPLDCTLAICSNSCNNGTCDAPEVCVCDAGWSGEFCDVPICTAAYQCVNGFCDKPNHCWCDVGWEGQVCDIPVCDHDCPNHFCCANGATCSAPFTCDCTPGWEGSTCHDAICPDPCINGNCTTPGNCTCDFDQDGLLYTGPTCNVSVCTDPCLNNGDCIAPDVCRCTTGWEGSICEVAICSWECVNGGNCTAPDNCTCADGWVGHDCSKPECDEPHCTIGEECVLPDTCISLCVHVECINGNCTGVDTCTCQTGWAGENCTDALCLSNVCVRGECILPEICDCTGTGYHPPNCSRPICYQTAGGCANGTCVAPDTCDCFTGYTGDQCEKPICGDWTPADGDYNPNTICINGGWCHYPGDCVCPIEPSISAPGYTDPICGTPVCPGDCTNQGECIGPNECECDEGYEGIDCSMKIVITLSFMEQWGSFIYAAGMMGGVGAFLCFVWQIRMYVDRKRLKQYLFYLDNPDHEEKQLNKADPDEQDLGSEYDDFIVHDIPESEQLMLEEERKRLTLRNSSVGRESKGSNSEAEISVESA